MVGGHVLEPLFHTGGPPELDSIRVGAIAKAEVKPEIIL
jgi:hypothetical protein